MLWKGVEGRKTEMLYLSPPLSPLPFLKYFLYFEIAAIRLFSLPTFSPTQRHTVRQTGQRAWWAPRPGAEDRTVCQGRRHSNSIRPIHRVNHRTGPVPPCSWRCREPRRRKRRCSSSLLWPVPDLREPAAELLVFVNSGKNITECQGQMTSISNVFSWLIPLGPILLSCLPLYLKKKIHRGKVGIRWVKVAIHIWHEN